MRGLRGLKHGLHQGLQGVPQSLVFARVVSSRCEGLAVPEEGVEVVVIQVELDNHVGLWNLGGGAGMSCDALVMM